MYNRDTLGGSQVLGTNQFCFIQFFTRILDLYKK